MAEGPLHKVQKHLRTFLRSRSRSTLMTPSTLSTSTLTQLTGLFLVLVLLSPPGAHAFGVCRSSFRCLNGGVERYGQSIFGPCRCRCPDGYTGPRCQHREAARKRSDSLNVLNDFLQRRQAQEQRELERQAMEEMEEERRGVLGDYDSEDMDINGQPMQRRRRGSRNRRGRRRQHPRFFRR